MPQDPYLDDEVRTALTGCAGVTEKRMFGGNCFLLNGNMLCGVRVGRFLFRVGVEQEPEALTWPGAVPMQNNGRRMKGFVWVDAESAMSFGLDRWLAMARKFVESLPVKSP